MKSLLLYLAGFATPFAIWAAIAAYGGLQDWRASRRYQRAWDKFGMEFDALTDAELALCQKKWAEEPWRFVHYCDDRARYFASRWNHGQTEEVK